MDIIRMGTTRIPITDPIRTIAITRLRSTGTADTAIITATIVTIGTIIAGNELTQNQKNPISWLGSNFEPAFLEGYFPVATSLWETRCRRDNAPRAASPRGRRLHFARLRRVRASQEVLGNYFPDFGDSAGFAVELPLGC